jgi:hypothetical protein
VLDQAWKNVSNACHPFHVQEEARERWAPILQHAHQHSTREVRRDTIFRDPRQAGPVEGSSDHEFQFIDDQRPIHRNCERLIALVELPPVHALAAVPEAYTSMVQQVARRRWLGV